MASAGKRGTVKGTPKGKARPGASPTRRAPGASGVGHPALAAHAPKGPDPSTIAGDMGTRTEKDSMGPLRVPADVLYGASTQRAVLNFPVSGQPVPAGIVRAYALIKTACARVNAGLGRLDHAAADSIERACDRVAHGLPEHGGWRRHFPVDVFQTGSGTSTNMNVNEVIANLVCVQLGAPIGSSKDPAYLARPGAVHPNDHANMGQSSNDTFPTAIHVAASLAIGLELLPALHALAAELEAKAKAWDAVVKIGRTHLMDATPIRLGQEFSGYAAQARQGIARLGRALETLAELPIGGTAVGTGINAHEEFGRRVCAELTRLCASGQRPPHAVAPSFREAGNHFEAQHAKDACVEASGHLRTLAVSLSKIAGDVRLLGSGPRCGIGELRLPAVQPGSSIMPGKVNPVIPEVVNQTSFLVIGLDTTVTLAASAGQLQLNVMEPVISFALFFSIRTMERAVNSLRENCVVGITANDEHTRNMVLNSLGIVTVLKPLLGYKQCAEIAREGFAQGKPLHQIVVLERKLLTQQQWDEMFSFERLINPDLLQ